MNPVLEQRKQRSQSNLRSNFNFHMTIFVLSMLVLSILGCRLTKISIGNITPSLIGFMLLLIALLAIYRNSQNRIAAIMTIPWIFLLIPVIAYPMLIAARLNFPLQDAHLARFDQLFGINVHNMVMWAAHNPFGRVIHRTYSLLVYLLLAAALLPALTGKLKSAREFVIANLVVIAIGIPLFALLPAVGPWYFYHFHPTSLQVRCQTQLLLLRSPGVYNSANAAGVICFPSFHVIWAILCPAALWKFRLLRIPLALLSAMIILSTMITGWHYFADVLGGIILAVIAVALSKLYSRIYNPGTQELG